MDVFIVPRDPFPWKGWVPIVSKPMFVAVTDNSAGGSQEADRAEKSALIKGGRPPNFAVPAHCPQQPRCPLESSDVNGFEIWGATVMSSAKHSFLPALQV